MIKKIKATISYTVDQGHADFDCGLKENHIYTYSDTYNFNNYESNQWDSEDLETFKAGCKQDLLLVAAGGYDYKGEHVHDVTYKIEEI